MAEYCDRRVRKTEALLLKGLTKLMKTKSIKEITVRELADEIDINRSTFYLHYKDIYDMVEKIENNLVDKIVLSLDELSKSRITQSTLMEFLNDVYSIIYSNADICAVLLSENGDIGFNKKIRKIIHHKAYDIVKNLVGKNCTENQIRVATCYFVSGITGIIEAWLQDISLGTPETIAHLSCNLIKNGISSFNV
jgi:AcrR family transcriptional regulator